MNDSVLQTMVNALTNLPSIWTNLHVHVVLYADLRSYNYRANNNPEATIPANFSVTSDRPDLVLISGKDIIL